MSATCVRCGGEVDGTAYVDTRCMDRARAQLAEIADMVPAARDIAYRLSATESGSGSAGKPGSRLPLDLTATAKLDAITNALGTWLRHVAEERGTDTADVSHWYEPIEGIATKLGNHLEWMRHRPEADEFLGDIEAAHRVIRGIVRGPAEQRYLGPCGEWAVFEADPLSPTAPPPPVPCDGDVYAIVHTDGTTARTGRCKTCSAEVDTHERTAWLDAEVRQRAFTAREIADAYGVNVKTIRSWHARGQLAQHGADRDGRPLHNLGEVLDLAAADAARRESERAKRARRAAARAAESEDAA